MLLLDGLLTSTLVQPPLTICYIRYVFIFFQNIVVHSLVTVVKICCIELYASISDSMGSRMSIYALLDVIIIGILL